MSSTGSTGRPNRQTARQIADLLPGALEKAIARRSGMNIDLLAAWDEIAGPEYADCTRPEKIKWPRRASQVDPFEPGQLTVACDGARALFFQHEIPQIIERLNYFFGFEAIAKIRVLQKPMAPARKQPPQQEPLTEDQSERLERVTSAIEDPELRKRLDQLGRGILSRRTPK